MLNIVIFFPFTIYILTSPIDEETCLTLMSKILCTVLVLRGAGEVGGIYSRSG